MSGFDEGYTMRASDWETLAQEYLFEELRVDRDLFALGQGYDCYYPNNYQHAEIRADGLFIRPSYASKLILKSSLQNGVFHSKTQHYGYHGTPPKNLNSILRTGLRASSSGAAGPGLYFSPYPLYAQLYSSSSYTGSPPTQWTSKNGKTYFVDILLMIRYPKELVSQQNGAFAVRELSATIGSQYDIHKLYKTATWASPNRGYTFEEMVIGCLDPSVVSQVTVQGVIVKFHATDPYKAGGEFDTIQAMMKQKGLR